jgi:hypothetical protein
MDATQEDRIEHWIEQLESDKVFEGLINKLENDQSSLLAYIYLPEFDELSEDEASYLLFLAILLYAAYTDGGKEEIVAVSLDTIQEIEDKTWSMWEKLSGNTFDKKLEGLPDEFWDPYKDLVAMMIEYDEEAEHNLSFPAQEILFVSLLTFYEAMQTKEVINS